VQPESGTTSYTYDVVGNVATKKDNRQITTYFTYDAEPANAEKCRRSPFARLIPSGRPPGTRRTPFA
jgi:hypothetical protein